MPFLSSVRGGLGPQGRFGKRGGPFGNGANGPLTVSSSTTVNSYAYITDASRTTSQNSCTVDSTTGFSVGSVVLIHQTQCASNQTLIGRMQKNVITNISGTTITFRDNFSWGLISGSTNTGSANACQIVTIPQYTSLTVASGGSVVPTGWNGQKGGIVVLETDTSITIDSGGSINATAKGFRGGNGGTGKITAGAQAGYNGETATGGGLSYGSRGLDGLGNGQAGVNGHVNLHGTTAGSGYSQEGGSPNPQPGGAGYGAGGGCKYTGGDAGAAGGSAGALVYDLPSYRFTLGAGSGGGAAGSRGNNTGGSAGGGGGAGGGLIIIHSPLITNNGTIVANPGYGAGGAGGFNNASDHGNYAGGVGGDSTNSGYGQKGANSQNTQQTSGGAGTGTGGDASFGGSFNGVDRGGYGGWTGLNGGGNGGKGSNGGPDGVGGGGAGGHGGGAGGGSSDVSAGGGGGQGGSGGHIVLIGNSFSTTGTVRACRGLGGGGSGGSNGWSDTQAGNGGDAQFNPASKTGYRNGADGAASTNGGGGGGSAGYVGSIGQATIYTLTGSYTGSVSTTDNAQSETGISINTGTSGSTPLDIVA